MFGIWHIYGSHLPILPSPLSMPHFLLWPLCGASLVRAHEACAVGGCASAPVPRVACTETRRESEKWNEVSGTNIAGSSWGSIIQIHNLPQSVEGSTPKAAHAYAYVTLNASNGILVYVLKCLRFAVVRVCTLVVRAYCVCVCVCCQSNKLASKWARLALGQVNCAPPPPIPLSIANTGTISHLNGTDNCKL